MSLPSVIPTVEELDTLEETRWQVQRLLFHTAWLPTYLGDKYATYQHAHPSMLENLFPEVLMWGPEHDRAKRTMKLLRKQLKHDFTPEVFAHVRHLSDRLNKAWSKFYLQPEIAPDGLLADMPLCYLNLALRGSPQPGGSTSHKLPGYRKLNMVLFQHVHWQLTGESLDYNRIAYNVALACNCNDVFRSEPVFQPVAETLTVLREKYLGETR